MRLSLIDLAKHDEDRDPRGGPNRAKVISFLAAQSPTYLDSY